MTAADPLDLHAAPANRDGTCRTWPPGEARSAAARRTVSDYRVLFDG